MISSAKESHETILYGTASVGFKSIGFVLRRLLLVGSIVLLASIQTAENQSQPVTVGYRDFNYATTVYEEPTRGKAESKLWINDGIWWGSLWSPSANMYTIHRFELATQSWTNTGTAIDERKESKADTLWDGQRLYVVSHDFSTSPGPAPPTDRGRLYRYSYNPVSKTYSLDSGFPVNVNRSKSETLVVAKNSTGQLWVTWTESGKVMINRSTTDDLTWGTPFFLPVQPRDVAMDDISSIVAFSNKIGVMWSNQNDKKMYFAVHLDSNADDVWQPPELALSDQNGDPLADDHINLKLGGSDANGNVYAATKTNHTNPSAPLIFLLKRDVNGVWSHYVFARKEDGHTRPIVLIDNDSQQVYMFASRKKHGLRTIYMKSSSLSNIQFPQGLGTPFIESATDLEINNPTSTKQALNSATGLLVLASDSDSRYYMHNYMDLSAGKPVITSLTPTTGLAGLK